MGNRIPGANGRLRSSRYTETMTARDQWALEPTAACLQVPTGKSLLVLRSRMHFNSNVVSASRVFVSGNSHGPTKPTKIIWTATIAVPLQI
jgi:hypothetical protein